MLLLLLLQLLLLLRLLLLLLLLGQLRQRRRSAAGTHGLKHLPLLVRGLVRAYGVQRRQAALLDSHSVEGLPLVAQLGIVEGDGPIDLRLDLNLEPALQGNPAAAFPHVILK